jgi:hypothetical protein
MRERRDSSTVTTRDEGETPTRLESLVSVDECARSRDPEPRLRGSLCVELALRPAAASSVISATAGSSTPFGSSRWDDRGASAPVTVRDPDTRGE